MVKEKNRGIVKWAGGKQRILEEVLSYFPSSANNYYEPFCGGGSIFLNLDRFDYTHKHISDGNSYLINVYKQVRDRPEDVIKRLEWLANKNSKEFYMEHRKTMPMISGVKQAALFLYMNRVCFNGIYRENSKGEFNVPYGSEVTYDTIVQQDNIRKISEMIQDMEFSHLMLNDFYESIIGKEDLSDSFFYFDPPYYGTFSGYLKDVFDENAQIKLFELCKIIDERGGKFALSNSNHNFIKNLYTDFTIEEISVKRSISAKTSSRKKINEIIVHSN